LAEIDPRTVLLPILLLHAMRHLGLMFLAPGAVFPGVPSQFATPAAFGDLLAAVLALIAIPAVAMRARYAKLLVWIFNIEGTLDLIVAISLATIYNAAPFMGPAYWIPAFWVPAGHALYRLHRALAALAGVRRNGSRIEFVYAVDIARIRSEPASSLKLTRCSTRHPRCSARRIRWVNHLSENHTGLVVNCGRRINAVLVSA